MSNKCQLRQQTRGQLLSTDVKSQTLIDISINY